MKKEQNIIFGYKTGISKFSIFQVHKKSGWVRPTLLIFKLYML